MATEYKLSYTATDINAKLGKIDSLASKNELPTKTSDLINDSDFATESYVQEYAQPVGDYALHSDVSAFEETITGVVAAKAEKTYVDEEIDAATSAQSQRIDAIEAEIISGFEAVSSEEISALFL